MYYFKLISLIFVFISIVLNISGQVQVSNECQRIPGVVGYSAHYDSPSVPVSRGGQFPASYSLKKYAPPVGDQMMYGTCVGWATTYAGMTILENIALDRSGLDLKEENCMSPQLTYDLCRLSNDSTCSKGTYVMRALKALENFGAITLNKYPYSCKLIGSELMGVNMLLNNQTDQALLKETLITAKQRRLSGFVSAGGPSIVQNVKYYLTLNMPVIISAEMYNSIERNSISGVWNGAMDDYPGGHAMCVIGYDDTKEGGAFEILNSWGNDWSDGGYIWFRYSDFAKVVDEAFALKGIELLSNDSIDGLNNFGVNIQAIGKNTSKSLEINNAKHKFKDLDDSEDFKIGGFLNKVIINYPSDEQSFSLSVQNVTNEGIYVYAFSMKKKNGLVSFLAPASSQAKKYNAYGEGLILPFDQQSSIPLNSRDELCVLLSKTELDLSEIQESLEESYLDLEDFVQTNFRGRIALNLSKCTGISGNVLKIQNADELNEILPIFLSYEMKDSNEDEELDDKLFEDIDITGSELFKLKYSLAKYKKGFFENSRKIKLDVREVFLSFGMMYRVKIRISEVNSWYMDDFDDTKNDDFVVFKSSKKDLYNKVQTKIFEYLVANSVDFRID